MGSTSSLQHPSPFGGMRKTLHNMMSSQPQLMVFTGVMLALLLPTTLLLVFDDRAWRDAAIWSKPLKFMLSTAAFAATTARFILFLPTSLQKSALIKKLSWMVVGTSTFEVFYISWQAAVGDGSHYNYTTTLHSALFTLMLVGAVCLSATQVVLAWLIARYSVSKSLFVNSVVVGLLLTFFLATVSGALLGGIQPPPGTGLPIVGWHLGQPDARPAHFLGVHANQLIPLGGWLLQSSQAPAGKFWLAVLAVVYTSVWALLTIWALP